MSDQPTQKDALNDLAYSKNPAYLQAIGPFEEYQHAITSQGFFDIIENNFSIFQKIGVFGSYRTQADRNVIKHICEHIANQGHVVFTGKGYYHPATPNVFQPLVPLMPTSIQDILNDLSNDVYFFSQTLPSIIDKAISRVAPIRTNYIELLACDRDRYNKPVLGFADAPNIEEMDREKCNWIDILRRQNDLLMSCNVNHKLSCPMDHDRDVHCIFYRPHGITQIIKTQFLQNEWKYYSLSDYNAIFPFIDNFLN